MPTNDGAAGVRWRCLVPAGRGCTRGGGVGGVVDVVGVGDEVGLAMCPGDGYPQLAKTRRHLTVGRASEMLSVGPVCDFCILVGLPAGPAGSAAVFVVMLSLLKCCLPQYWLPQCCLHSEPALPVNSVCRATLPGYRATGLQILTFRPLPIKPHVIFIGKG